MAATDLIIRILSQFKGKGFEEGSKEAKKFKSEITALGRELGAGIGLGLVAREIGDFVGGAVMAADQGRAVARTFTSLSGSAEAAAENMAAMREATRGLVDETTQQRIANQLLGMNIVQTADQLEEVVNVSRRLGKEFRGLGADEAANEFAIMMSNMSVARLDSFGISSGAVRKRIDELMESTEGMTREQAFFQATMEEANKTMERLGPEITTTADRVDELGARWSDFQADFGELISGEDIGLIDQGVVALTVFVEKLSAGAEAWSGVKEDIKSIASLLGISDQFLAGLGEGIKAAGLGTFGSDIARETGRRLEQQQDQQEDANNKAQQAEVEQGDELLGVKREFTRELLDIQEETNERLADEAEAFADQREDLEEDHQDTIADIRKRSAKQLVKLQRDLQKDLAKEDEDLKKDLSELEEDQSKRVADFKEKTAKEEKRQRKIERIDALADERLFQFELRQLAAEGEGNAIKAALERRQIEEEIAKEKAQVEQQIEDEKAQETIENIREEGAERRAQLLQDNQERKALLEERHQEEVAELNEQLAEQLAAENENFAERKADLAEHYDERIAEIREGEAEAVSEVAKALTETEEITTSELSQLTPIARAIGEETGKQFATGIAEGYRENQTIEGLIGQAAEGGIQPVSQSQREAIEQLSGGVAMFQNEGVVTGRFGIAHQGEVVLNPNNQGSLGGGTIQIGGQEFITSHAARLAEAINGQRQRDMQALVDTLAGLMD